MASYKSFRHDFKEFRLYDFFQIPTFGGLGIEINEIDDFVFVNE